MHRANIKGTLKLSYRIMTYILSQQERDQNLLVFQYPCPNIFFLRHKYAMKGFYKEFVVQPSFVGISQIIKIGGTFKTNI